MVKSRSEADAVAGAARAARRLTRVAPASVRVMGPAPAPLHRVNRWWRHHVLLFGRSATTLHRCVEAAGLEEGGRAGTVTTLDMDPSDVL